MGPEVATVEQIKGWTMTYSQTPHKASSPGIQVTYYLSNFFLNILGILCLDLHPSNQDLVMTGGVDKTAIVFSRESRRKEVCYCLTSISMKLFLDLGDLSRSYEES